MKKTNSKPLTRESKTFHEYMGILKILSEEIRVRLLILLRNEELTVGEIQYLLNLKQSNLSSHLNLLRQHSLLTSRKEGQKVFYKTANFANLEAKKIIEDILNTSTKVKQFNEDIKRMQEVIENRKARSQEFFNRNIKSVNELATPGQIPEVFLLGFIHLIQGKVIADFGCGQGSLCRVLAEAGNHVVGIDNSEKQISTANANSVVSKTKTSSTKYLLGDIENTTLKAGSFDLVTICHALHHTANPQKAIAESFRLLNAGGKLIIFDLDHHQNPQMEKKFGDFWMGFRNDELLYWLTSLNYRIIYNQVITKVVYPLKKNLSKNIKPLVLIAQKPLE